MVVSDNGANMVKAIRLMQEREAAAQMEGGNENNQTEEQSEDEGEVDDDEVEDGEDEDSESEENEEEAEEREELALPDNPLPAAACLLDHTVASVLLTADQQLIEAAKLYFISEVCILRVLRDVIKHISFLLVLF